MKHVSTLEIPFSWTCPKCGHRQTDTVNPDFGPYLNVTCGECAACVEQQEMAPADAQDWDAAMLAAEEHTT